MTQPQQEQTHVHADADEPKAHTGMLRLGTDSSPDARQKKWEHYTQAPLIVASLVYLIAYTWRVTGELHGEAYTVANWAMGISRSMFIVDYIVRLNLAENRWRWFRTNLASLAWSILPVLRLVLLLKIFTRMQGRKATPGDRMRIRIIVYGAGSAAILIYLSALGVLDAERYSAHANIKSFEDAIWWACVTVTTTGYGDFTPVTGAGRMIGVTLMFGGLMLLGVTTAILGSLMMEIATRHTNPNTAPATRGQVHQIYTQNRQLQAMLDEQVKGTHAASHAELNADSGTSRGPEDRHAAPHDDGPPPDAEHAPPSHDR